MPKLIKDGVVTDDSWSAPNGETTPGQNTICTLAQWLELSDKSGTAVQLEPGDDLSPLLAHLNDIALVAVNFPTFTDGRCFTYARELRDRGYAQEIRAVGNFIRDQITYLQRVGVNAFQWADESSLDEALGSLGDFSEFYQASTNEPLPLFRRRT